MPDLREMRRDPAAFAVEVNPEPLVDWQLEELRRAPKSRISTWLWSRQASKSLLLALLGLWAMFRESERVVLIVSGGGELGARRVLADMSRIVAASPMLAASVADDVGGVLALDNGSQARALALSESAMRGWRAHVVLGDEFQLAPASVLPAVLPTLTAAEEPLAVFAGTAGRSDGDWFDLCRRGEVGDAHVSFSRRVSRFVGGPDSMPWQSPSMIEAAMTAMGSLRAAAEYRTEWATGGAFVFDRADVDAVTADFAPDSLATMRGPASVWAGLDLATTGRDQSALVALGRVPVQGPSTGTALALRCAHLWEPRYPLMAPEGGPSVFSEIAASPMRLEALRMDGTGTQAGFAQYLFPLLRRRRADLGGGRRPPPAVLLEEQPDGTARAVSWDATGREVPWRPPRLDASAGVPASLGAIAFSSQMKTAAVTSLRVLLQSRGIVLPAAAVDLRQQLLSFQGGLTATGFDTFEGDRDDLVDALLLALRPYRRRDGAWRVMAADLAASGVLEGGASGAGELVRTGPGTALRARPAWRSMTGPGATEPEGAAVPDRRADPKWDGVRHLLKELEERSATARKGAAGNE